MDHTCDTNKSYMGLPEFLELHSAAALAKFMPKKTKKKKQISSLVDDMFINN